MKTQIFTPAFYLVNKEMVFKITSQTVLGRNTGDIVFEDDPMLSSIHCIFTPSAMNLSVKDLNSTNGVFVNKTKIPPETDFKLNVGDSLKIGAGEYILCDNENDVKKVQPPKDRRSHSRPKNLYTYENILTFYSAPALFRYIYLIVILLSLGSFFLNLHFDTPVPAHLRFLSNLYSEQIILSGIKMVFLVWIISFIHSFFLNIYFNRNPLRKGISLVVYGLILFKFVDFSHGPLGGVKRYLVERQSIEQLEPKGLAVVRLKKITTHQDEITSAFKFVKSRLFIDEQKELKADYKKMMDKMRLEIKNIKVAEKD